MKISFGQPGETYGRDFFGRALETIAAAFAKVFAKGENIEPHPGAIILRSPNGTRYQLGVSNVGATTWTAV